MPKLKNLNETLDIPSGLEADIVVFFESGLVYGYPKVFVGSGRVLKAINFINTTLKEMGAPDHLLYDVDYHGTHESHLATFVSNIDAYFKGLGKDLYWYDAELE